jgi:hypothetical protein
MIVIRRAGTTCIAALAVLPLSVGLAYAIAPAWAERVGLDLWNYPAACDSIQESRARAEAIHRERARLELEIEMAQHLAEGLAGGKLTLRDAVGRLEPILARRAGFHAIRESAYAAPTFRAAVARYAINHVREALLDDPSRWFALSVQLEIEYADISAE